MYHCYDLTAECPETATASAQNPHSRRFRRMDNLREPTYLYPSMHTLDHNLNKLWTCKPRCQE